MPSSTSLVFRHFFARLAGRDRIWSVAVRHMGTLEFMWTLDLVAVSNVTSSTAKERHSADR